MVVSGEKRRFTFLYHNQETSDHTLLFTYRSRQHALVKQRVKGLDRIQGEKKFGEIGKVNVFKEIKAEHIEYVL